MRCSIITLLAVFMSATAFAGSITITEETTFHAPSWCTGYNEAFPESNGGTLFLFVKNEGSSPETIADVLINGTAAAKSPGVKWWRCWPPVLGVDPGNSVSTITIQSTDAPLSQGEHVTVDVVAASGARDSQKCYLVPQGLRLANIIATHDMRSLLVYVRNDGTKPYSIEQVLVNNQSFLLGKYQHLRIASGEYEIAPGAVDILKVDMPEPVAPLTPFAIRVGATQDGTRIWTGAPIRVLTPWFPLGTWSSSLSAPENARSRDFARTLHLDAAVGSNDWERLSVLAREHHIGSINIVNKPDSKRPDLDTVRAQTGNPDILAWCIRDEPDLHGIPSELMFQSNQAFWEADSNHPTFLNLMTTRAFNEFGQIPDIAGMDHYVQYAPNAIPYTGVLRKARMEEAIDYTWSLKLNTEPKPMWVWAELADRQWAAKPTRWGIDYQFWGHVMSGAKGILWFTYGPGREDDFPEQVDQAKRVTQTFSQIRTLCLYGEPSDCVDTLGAEIKARALVSNDAMVVILINNKYSTPGFPWAPTYKPKPQQGSVVVTIPKWIKTDRVLQVTPAGASATNYSLDGNKLRLDYGIYTESLVYVIAKLDTEPPEPPEGLVQIASEGGGFVLSWEEPYDNVGIKGYKVYLNGSQIADSPYPIVKSDQPPAPDATYTVAAYDSANNLGNQSAAAVR